MLLGVTPVGVLLIVRPWKSVSDDARVGCAVPLFVFGALALSMLISALMTVPPARAADRAFEAFRNGHFLARWEYGPAQWDAHVGAKTRLWRRSALVAMGIVFLPVLAIAAWIGYSVPQVHGQKIFACGTGAVVTLTVAAGTYSIAKIQIRRRATSWSKCPRAYIGLTAIYCGGVFNFWGSQLRALQSVALEKRRSPSEPDRLLFVIGSSRSVRRVAKIVDVASAAVMRPAFASTYLIRQEIPVPDGEQQHAREIVAQLHPSP